MVAMRGLVQNQHAIGVQLRNNECLYINTHLTGIPVLTGDEIQYSAGRAAARRLSQPLKVFTLHRSKQTFQLGDVNDAERLRHDPAMCWMVGHRAISGAAASASQMGRFETKWLSRPENPTALVDLPGHWIDKVRRRRPMTVILGMDSSEGPTYGDQECRSCNVYFS